MKFKGDLTLPLAYNHILQSFIYHNIDDEPFRSTVHDVGFIAGNKHTKLFTFSRLIGTFVIDQKNKEIRFKSPVKWIVSGASDEFLSNFIDTVLKSNSLQLLGQKVDVAEFQPIFYNKELSRVQIEMLSPVTVYSTSKNNNKNFTSYYSPWDTSFNKLIRQNMALKALAIGRKVEKSEINLTVTTIGDRNPKLEKIIMFKDTPVHGWYGNYVLSGDPYLIKLAYEAGLGGKNSEGFGCFKILGNRE